MLHAYWLSVRKVQLPWQHLDCYVALKQHEARFGAGARLLGGDAADAMAMGSSPEVDETIQLPCYLMLENVSDLISGSLFYSLRKDWL